MNCDVEKQEKHNDFVYFDVYCLLSCWINFLSVLVIRLCGITKGILMRNKYIEEDFGARSLPRAEPWPGQRRRSPAIDFLAGRAAFGAERPRAPRQPPLSQLRSDPIKETPGGPFSAAQETPGGPFSTAQETPGGPTVLFIGSCCVQRLKIRDRPY